MDVFIAEGIVFRLCCGWCCMGVKGGKRPETEFPMGKVDVLRGASFVTDWCFSRFNQLSALGFGRRARLRFMSKKWEWVKTGLRGNRKRTRRGKSYVLRLNRFLTLYTPIKKPRTPPSTLPSPRQSRPPLKKPRQPRMPPCGTEAHHNTNKPGKEQPESRKSTHIGTF